MNHSPSQATLTPLLASSISLHQVCQGVKGWELVVGVTWSAPTGSLALPKHEAVVGSRSSATEIQSRAPVEQELDPAGPFLEARRLQSI